MFFEPGVHSQHASMKQMGLEMFCILDVMYKKKDWQFVYSRPAWETGGLERWHAMRPWKVLAAVSLFSSYIQ